MWQFDGGQLRFKCLCEHAVVVHADHGDVLADRESSACGAFVHIPGAGIVEAEESVRMLGVEQIADCGQCRPVVEHIDDQMIVISGTTAETYLTKEYPDIPLQKYDSYATAKNALENGNGVAWANDNTEVIAFAKQNTGYTVGIPSLGSQDTIAPAVSQGNTTVLDWLNEEIKALGEENFFHKDYEETLVDTYGLDYEDELVVEGGVTGGADAASSEAASSEAASSEAAASEVASSAAAQ